MNECNLPEIYADICCIREAKEFCVNKYLELGWVLLGVCSLGDYGFKYSLGWKKSLGEPRDYVPNYDEPVF